MTIGSVSGSQMSWSVAQTRPSGPLPMPPQSASRASGGSTGASGTTTENAGFFQGGMAPDTMAGLLQAQGAGGGFTPPSLSDMDSDGDGSLTQAEFESYGTSVHGDTNTSKADEQFSKMDTDGDGTVTSDEKDTFDAMMKSQGPGGPRGPGKPEEAAEASTTQTTSSQDLTALMQELLTALDAYRSSTAATVSAATTTTSIAA